MALRNVSNDASVLAAADKLGSGKSNSKTAGVAPLAKPAFKPWVSAGTGPGGVAPSVDPAKE